MATRALLDFGHRASYTMKDLQLFHDLKSVFAVPRACDTEHGFAGIPKIHMMQHYTPIIRELGTCDGYNTEATKRLHIDYAKVGYRAGNKNEYIKQMTIFLQRREAVKVHNAYLRWKEGKEYDEEMEEDMLVDEDNMEVTSSYNCETESAWREQRLEDFDGATEDAEDAEMEGGADRGGDESADDEGSDIITTEGRHLTYLSYPNPTFKIAQKATRARRSIKDLEAEHSVYGVANAIRKFLVTSSGRRDVPVVNQNEQCEVWTRMRLIHAPAPFHAEDENAVTEIIRATPKRKKQPEFFDTVLLETDPKKHGINSEFMQT